MKITNIKLNKNGKYVVTIDNEKYNDESYSQYLKKLKTCELTKILNDNSNQRANNIKENIKRKGNIKNEEIYDRMLNCEIKQCYKTL